MESVARLRLIETTARLLQVQGYHNTGLNQIVAEAEAPKGSLYHYFPGGKVALAVTAIEHSAQQTARILGELAMAQPDAQRGLAAPPCRRESSGRASPSAPRPRPRSGSGRCCDSPAPAAGVRWSRSGGGGQQIPWRLVRMNYNDWSI